jgi:hypothetical protein
MKHKERYTVYNSKNKVILRTDDLSEAFKTREDHKSEGAYIEDRKNKNKHRTNYLG